MEDTCPICGKQATKVCSSCRGVSYCSVEHQKTDWKAHKKVCRLYEIKSNEQFGRYTIAVRDIAAGTIVMSEAPIMIGPKPYTLPLCLGCHKKLKNSQEKYYCSKCDIFPMCGPQCEHMEIHAENECKIFQAHRPTFKPIANFDEGHPAYECIMTIRCLLLKKKDPKKWKKLTNMQAQNETRKTTLPGLWHRNEVNTVCLLRDHCKFKEFSAEEIHTVLGYSDINSFEIKIGQVDASGLFDNTFIMAHDCISNTHHSFTEDLKMVVRTTLSVKKGEPITTTYAHTLEGTLERRADLRHSKFFECTCQRCSDPTELGSYFSAIVCSKCPGGKGFMLPKDPLNTESEWTCSSFPVCQFQMSSAEVIALTTEIKNEIENVRKEDDNIIERVEELLKKYKGSVLHPNHFLIIDLESSLVSFYGRMKGWLIGDLNLGQLERKESLCRHVLQVLDILEPGLSRIRGVTLYELHAAVYFSSSMKFKRKKMTAKELKERIQEVLLLLKESQTILSFDSPNTMEGAIATSIPTSIARVQTSLAEL